MKLAPIPRHVRQALCLLTLSVAPLGAWAQASTYLAQYPLILGTAVNPNILIVLDNSGSMEENMDASWVSRTGSNSRDNIAKSSLTTLVTNYRSNFNFGLETLNQTISGCPNRYTQYYPYPNAYSTQFPVCATATGPGTIVEGIKPDSTTHFTALTNALSPTGSGKGEILEGDGTPTVGALQTALQVFAGTSTSSSPISKSCQKNYVVLATDGEPNMDASGNCYDSKSCGTTTKAVSDVVTAVTNLRSTKVNYAASGVTGVSGKTFSIETYVIGLGNEVGSSTLNKMAAAGDPDGKRTAYMATDQKTLDAAFQSIVTSISAKNSAAASVAVNAKKAGSASYAYQATFSSADWSGQLLAIKLDSSGNVICVKTSSGSCQTDSSGNIVADTAWQAASVLNSQVAGSGWNTNRTVITWRTGSSYGGGGIAFRWPSSPSSPGATDLSSSQVTALNTPPIGSADSYGQQRLNYLRGDTTYEVRNCGSGTTCPITFRNRSTTVLGDIVDSNPLYVAAPSETYYNSIEPSAKYSAFAQTYASRTPVIYVGANDGMLHAFRASDGTELMAYIPSIVFGNLSRLTSTAYSHVFYVDGSPAVDDVFYGGSWHSLLVSGMGAGGKGVFALDVTNPANFKESNASSIARWEYTASTSSSDASYDMGYVSALPVMGKTNDGNWVVIVNNGYDSASHKAVLYILNAQTGALIKRIDTGATGTASAPNGLSGVTTLDVDGNGTIDAVYAGDLYGNVWKFDLSSTSSSSWGVAFGGKPLFQAQYVDSSTKATVNQPITVVPRLTASPKGGYVVLFGTGELLTTTDPSSTITQSIYGIWDKTSASITPSGSSVVARSNLQKQSLVTTVTLSDGSTGRVNTHAVDKPSDATLTGDNAISSTSYYSSDLGWYYDLPVSGERLLNDPTPVVNGLLEVVTNVVADCTSSGTSYPMYFNAFTGNRPDSAVFDNNGDNNLSTADFVNVGTSSAPKYVVVSGKQYNGILTSPASQKVGSSTKQTFNSSDGSTPQVLGPGAYGDKVRIMWQELNP